MFFQVAVNVPTLSGLFDYHLPAELEGKVQPGSLVVVPFGRQTVQGVVVRPVDQPQVLETRPIQVLLDPEPALTPAQLALAQELAEQTLSPLADCINLMLPPGLAQQADTLFHATGFTGADPRPLSPLQQKILALLKERGDLRGRQLTASIPHVEWKTAAQALLAKGWITARPVLPPPTVRPKFVRTVQLALPPPEAQAVLEKISMGSTLPRRQAILSFLEKEPWPVSVQWAYAASAGKLDDLLRMAEAGIVSLGETEMFRDPLEGIREERQAAPPLTEEQSAAWQEISARLPVLSGRTPESPVLLHGVTGSGKTELYLKAVEATIQAGRQAIVLVPEISLTPQTVRRFIARFPGQVGLVHSRLTEGERYDTWRRARAGQLSVIVGPRSALFTPLPNPGLIVVDECHDQSYYQADVSPPYSTLAAVQIYARMTGALLVLGSATPGIELVYQAREEKWPVLRLAERIYAHVRAVQEHLSRLGVSIPAAQVDGEMTSLPLPPVQLVDMRNELKEGNRSIFSRALQDALAETLERQQQAILFLNRRGAATYIFCRDCGYVLRCPHCDFPLTFHTDDGALQCHTCNYSRQLPKKCPDCRSEAIRQYGTGTEKVESDLLALFPQARALRYDYETTRQRGAHDLMLAHFASHHADVLVGTQMVAKGLDLPLVTLVGIVLADVGLTLPDFRAGERAFQVLTQVAGRAGRSPLGGRVVLQTFQPQHYAIQAAAGHDYSEFYRRELEYRRQMGYPPFSRLARLEFRSLKEEEAEGECRQMAAILQARIDTGGFTATDLIGPVPCFFRKEAGYFRWQVVVRGPNITGVLSGLSLGKCRVEIDPPSLL